MYIFVWVILLGVGIKICLDGVVVFMGFEYVLYIFVWLILMRVGIDICLDGNGWIVFVCMGFECVVVLMGFECVLYIFVWLDGNG